MSIQTLSRCGIALFCAVLVSGCSLLGFGSDSDSRSSSASSASGACAWNRSSCMHEGKYEPGEKEYAEEEAKRLNKAQSVRMRSRW
ncbi:MAG: hypothetical protein WBA83_01965 [Burkholderiaceae bacterium]